MHEMSYTNKRTVMMIDPKISVVINTYNAEKYLAEVLDSAKGFDEILICDMESTDRTCSIAKEYGCKIVTFEKKNHHSAEPARTFAIQSASTEWVLVVDADELIPEDLKNYLYKCIKEPDCPAGIYIPRKNYFMGKFMHCHYPDYLLRFFRREGTVWPPYVHTFPIVQGRLEKIAKDQHHLAFVHLANDGVRDIVRKTNQYTENEIEKKKKKRYGTMALLHRPLFRFFKTYILKGGIRDGKEGFIRACLEGYYQFIMVAKILENRKGKSSIHK